MKPIEIATAQNVTIEHQLASVFIRGIAFLIDFVIIYIVGYFILFPIISVFSDATRQMLAFFTVIPFVFFYSLAFEMFNKGQSPGKMLLKIRVIRLDGSSPQFLDYVMRWVFRIIDIYGSLGSIAILSIVASPRAQRLGDTLANTIVVKVSRQEERMKLNNLMKINTLEKYQPVYSQVTDFSEETMLLVKETLHRAKAYPNYAHTTARKLLVKKIEQELGIKASGDETAFLKCLLKDYVALTR